MAGPRPLAALLLIAAAQAQGSGSCGRSLVRYNSLGQQALVKSQSDAEFPAAMASIAPAGVSCGDEAHGIKGSCDMYNSWKDIRDVAKSAGRPFKLVGEGGFSFKDVSQGDLATCYLMAASAALARSNPASLEAMFVKRERWAEGIYTTRWMLGGRVTEVQVDGLVPVGDEGPFFAQPSLATGVYWPLVVEKAWAKIYGTYKSVEGGLWETVIQAITLAPVARVVHSKSSKEELFQRMMEATEAGWPMCADSAEKALQFGMASSHVYTVLEAREDPKWGKVFKMFNPWSADGYKGKIPNGDLNDGLFTMKLDEYFKAFSTSSMAILRDGYRRQTRKVLGNASPVAWSLKVSDSKPFYLVLSWPGERIMLPCKTEDPNLRLVVTKKGQVVAEANLNLDEVPSATLPVTAGAGDYLLLLSMEFSANAVKEAYLTVHSAKPATLAASDEDAEALLTAIGEPTTSTSEATTTTEVVTTTTEGYDSYSAGARKPIIGVVQEVPPSKANATAANATAQRPAAANATTTAARRNTTAAPRTTTSTTQFTTAFVVWVTTTPAPAPSDLLESYISAAHRPCAAALLGLLTLLLKAA